MFIGYHASHEQFSPRQLLEYAQLAEKSGFSGVMSSDHITPWSVRQGNSGHAWPWLGAAMQATGIPFGCLAIPAGSRHHPAAVAHAFATLAEMFPDRLRWIAAGSGEAMNEHVTGEAWPAKEERDKRMKAAVDIIRRLWRGETVTEEKPVKIDRAKIWSLPQTPPKIYCAALSKETAAWAGAWADGLITVRQSRETLADIVKAFRDNGGKNRPVTLQLQLSWAPMLEDARAQAHDQWRHAGGNTQEIADLELPEEFDTRSEKVKPEDMNKAIFISADLQEHIRHIEDFADMGFSEIYLHNAGRNQAEFIAAFGRSVLPSLLRRP